MQEQKITFEEIEKEVAKIDKSIAEIEICGCWIWATTTKEHKDIFKNLGFNWARKKEKWYWKPSQSKSFGRGKYSMEEIRERHGSSKLN